MSGGKTCPGGAAAKGHGLRQVKGSCLVLVTQEEGKGQLARKEEDNNLEGKKERKKNTSRLLSCSLGRVFAAKGKFSLTSGREEPQREDGENGKKSLLEVGRCFRLGIEGGDPGSVPPRSGSPAATAQLACKKPLSWAIRGRDEVY